LLSANLTIEIAVIVIYRFVGVMPLSSLLGTVRAVKLWGRVIDKVCGNPFVYGTPIPLVHSFLQKSAYFGFVFL
jgi:hypothetical protein